MALKGDQIVNGTNKYAFNESERAEALSLLSIADYILLIGNEELKNVVQMLDPSVVVLGKEFEHSDDDEILDVLKIQKEKEFKIEFHAGEINYASTHFLKGSQSELSAARKKFFLETIF